MPEPWRCDSCEWGHWGALPLAACWALLARSLPQAWSRGRGRKAQLGGWRLGGMLVAFGQREARRLLLIERGGLRAHREQRASRRLRADHLRAHRVLRAHRRHAALSDGASRGAHRARPLKGSNAALGQWANDRTRSAQRQRSFGVGLTRQDSI